MLTVPVHSNPIRLTPLVPPRHVTTPPCKTSPLHTIFAHNRAKLLLTYFLFNLENLLRLSQPFVLGLAINDLLNESSFGLLLFVGQHLTHLLISTLRQIYDTRVYTGIYTDLALRERSAEGLLPLDFPGYAVGGLSVGETPGEMYSTLDGVVPMLPTGKPRYLMGVGRPIDLVEAVLRGIDLFDCVMPTRNGRNAMAFTSRGPLRLRNLKFQRDESPLDPDCPCPVCRQFSRAYLRHLFLVNEMLGPILVSWHNVAYYQTLLRDMRLAIGSNSAVEFRATQLARWGAAV